MQADVAAKRTNWGIRASVVRLDGKPVNSGDTLVFPGDDELTGRWVVMWVKYANAKLDDFQLVRLRG